MKTDPRTLDQLPTPSLVVERSLFDANVSAMSDPTVARHEFFWVVDGDDVVDCWPVDLRHW